MLTRAVWGLARGLDFILPRQVFAVDLLGQGSSWPVRPATPDDGLYLSIDVWRQQLQQFAGQVGQTGLLVSAVESSGWG